MLGDSVVLLVSSHGHVNKGTSDGKFVVPELKTIWMAYGGKIQEQNLNTTAITAENTAATALHALGIPEPDSVHGKPVSYIYMLFFNPLGGCK